VAVPESGARKQASILIAVLFPAPLGPRIPSTSPLLTSNDKESTATIGPKVRRIASIYKAHSKPLLLLSHLVTMLSWFVRIIIMCRKWSSPNCPYKPALVQLVQVRILVSRVSLADTINATIAAGLSGKHAYIGFSLFFMVYRFFYFA
jgi:hypothetical protein